MKYSTEFYPAYDENFNNIRRIKIMFAQENYKKGLEKYIFIVLQIFN